MRGRCEISDATQVLGQNMDYFRILIASVSRPQPGEYGLNLIQGLGVLESEPLQFLDKHHDLRELIGDILSFQGK